MSKHMYSTANLSDVELKDQGNRLFSSRKFDDAISCYSKAIVSYPLNMLIFCFHFFFFAEPSKTLSILNAKWVISRTDQIIGRKVHNICNHNCCNWIKLFSLFTSLLYFLQKLRRFFMCCELSQTSLLYTPRYSNITMSLSIFFCVHRLRIQQMLHILQIERYAI